MVCRWCGGRDESGSFVALKPVDLAGREGNGRAVALERVGESSSWSKPLEESWNGMGDLEGLGLGLVSRCLIHDRSVNATVLKGRDGVCDCDCDWDGAGFEGERVGVDCLRGEPCGVAARTVGERPTGDSGLRKGDARGELKASGAFAGLGWLDCDRVRRARGGV
jgi:hypothetical protein